MVGGATILTFVALLYLVELIDQLMGGIARRQRHQAAGTDGLWGIIFAPVLHANWQHLMANTVPLLVLGFLMTLAGLSRFVWATAIVWILGGFGTWLIGNVGSSCGPTDHIGASGLIFGWLAFLLVFGIFVRRFWDIVIGLVVLFVYGGVLLGAMPVLAPMRRRVVAGPFVRRDRRRRGGVHVVRAGTQGPRIEKSRHRPAARQDMSSPLAPVGVFDSGVGGLTVARAIIDQLPDEDIVYVGDTGNGPYGPLTIPEVRAHALAIGDDLVDRGVKALVIACNTASAACLRDARERYDVPVVEVILPAVRRAVATTRNGRIGVIGTQATIASHAYQDAFAAARDTEITAVACPRFVDFVERGVTSGRQVLGLAEGYLEPLQRAAGRHAGAGMHALSAAVRADPAGDGRQRHAGFERRGDRQGSASGAHRAGPAASA